MLDSTRHRVAILAAGLLIVLALGLPWTTSSEVTIPGWYVGSSCMPNLSDGTIWCTSPHASPGITTGAEALSGSGMTARVFLVGVLVLVVLAWIRGQSRLLAVAGAALVLGVLLAGLAVLGGQVASLLAAGLLLYVAFSAEGEPARV